MKSKVVLVHGYNKTSKDMLPLKYNLEILNYEVLLINLPLTVEKLDCSIELFKKRMEDILKTLGKNEKIHLVGHSTGGLLIRILLSKLQNIDKIGRCVLIATPNKGSKLADTAGGISQEIVKFFKVLKDLQMENIKERKIKNMSQVEIGAIAGNKNNLMLGSLLDGENDGRVRVNSVRYDGLTDFIVLQYNHKEIHHKFETARLIDNYFNTGKFKAEEYEKKEQIINKDDLMSVRDNSKFIGQFCEVLGGNMLNWDISTSGGKVFWKDSTEYNGWRLQQNKVTGHCRILNPKDYRKAWGSPKAMEKAINEIIQIQNYHQINNKFINNKNKEELLKILEKLDELRIKEIITEEEFNKKKNNILSRI
ncbi:hypothetical protein OW763_10245 [Clostridium aestuarii]|uniref:GPI inositol-deacylase PGAP1-like alpha/beta domain-containing protein n=1 Tax=Clostridium aestuarii TaxID=338193 RepID=A0ABT4D0F1_9CLOT|nr:alpha/beta fold hydrolase [Clostridium aestuarii]MCY6484721.1 hypothetical protein [Clostridium aestuarii]